MTKQEAFDFLNNKKVYVNGKSNEIQKLAFRAGYAWHGGGLDVQGLGAPFLFFEVGPKAVIYCKNNMQYFINSRCQEVSAAEILAIEIIERPIREYLKFLSGADEGIADGIYLILGNSYAPFLGQALTEEEKTACTGIGVKLGGKSLVVAMGDTYEEDTTLTDKSGGTRFITDYHKAVADWEGEANTNDIAKILTKEATPGDGWYIPSLGQLYFILLHFDQINAALEAAGGKPLGDDWYWSSTQSSTTGAWGLYLGSGGAFTNPKAPLKFRVRAVKNFLR